VAEAKGVRAPPGNSGVQEYVETLPDGTGGRSTNDVGHAQDLGPRAGQVLGQSARRALEAQGSNGRRAATLADATGPKRGLGDDHAAGGDSPLLGAVHRVAGTGGPGGMGLALPIIMLVSLLGAVGYLGWRRRTS
jgi:hypothetical protein